MKAKQKRGHSSQSIRGWANDAITFTAAQGPFGTAHIGTLLGAAERANWREVDENKSGKCRIRNKLKLAKYSTLIKLNTQSSSNAIFVAKIPKKKQSVRVSICAAANDAG